MCLALRASGLWLRFAALQNFIPSLTWIVPGWRALGCNPRKGRDQILPSGNLEVGNDILGEGGNAVDAAVAATFCMAAVAPHVTGIGGGGVMLVHMNRRSVSGLPDFFC